MDDYIKIRTYTQEEIDKMSPADLVMAMTRVDRSLGKKLGYINFCGDANEQKIGKENIEKKYNEVMKPLLDKYNSLFNHK